MSNSSIWPIDVTLSGTTTLSNCGPGSNGSEGVICIPQSSRTEASPSDSLVLYPGHWLRGGLTPLQRCSLCILKPQLPEQKKLVRIHIVYTMS